MGGDYGQQLDEVVVDDRRQPFAANGALACKLVRELGESGDVGHHRRRLHYLGLGVYRGPLVSDEPSCDRCRDVAAQKV